MKLRGSWLLLADSTVGVFVVTFSHRLGLIADGHGPSIISSLGRLRSAIGSVKETPFQHHEIFYFSAPLTIIMEELTEESQFLNIDEALFL